MDRTQLRTIIDGANEIQKECKKNYECNTCFFYAGKHPRLSCQIMIYVENDCENIGKNLSLQYLK